MEAVQPSTDERPLALPAPQPPVAPAPFPLVASIAPIVASVVIWAITQSPFALVFAALSPVIALAGVADGRWNARKARRAAAADRASALTQLRSELAQRQALERMQRRARTPTAAEAMQATGRIGRWIAGADNFATVTLGTGDVRSSLRVGGEPQTDGERELLADAATLTDAPFVSDATGGIALIGSAVLTRALARGYLVQLMHAFAPGTLRIEKLPATEWDWARSLPHYCTEADETPSVLCVLGEGDAMNVHGAQELAPRGGHRAVIAMADSLERLPVPCRVVIEITGPGTAHVVAGPQPINGRAFLPELITQAQAAGYALRLAEHAAATGQTKRAAELPATLRFDELDHRAADPAGSAPGSSAASDVSRLRAVVGVSTQGPLVLDLVTDGPHAVVGGTTGSGKSEFLTAWVAAMAARHTPAQVAFLLVDFKGGSAFTPLTRLRHCVGLITDLGHGEAERALSSLKAELRHRERVLGRLGVRDITEAAGELGRLVIVVDEFAAMLDTFPDLHALFVDIAARGRSLGVHVILCTQRPAGVVRDALLANCALRVSLRVNNAIDSIAVIGTDAASRLSAAQPGRCIVARDGTLLTAQIAQTSQADIDRMMGRNGAVNSDSPTAADACVVRRPWLDPLPALVPLPNTADPAGPVAPQAIVLGLEDVPEEQRQSFVSVRRQQLQLLAIGVHGSGKSVFVRTIADQWSGELRSADGSVEALWDALEWAENWCQDRTGPNECDSALLILDDLDALVGRMQQEYQDTAMDRLVHVLRNGPNADLAVVATAVTATAVLRRAVTLFGDTLLLRQPSRQEHVLAGASAALFDEQAHPGCGVWRGHKIQVAVSAAHVADRNHQPSPVTSVESLREGATILVTGSPAARIRSLRARTIQADVIDIADVAAGALPADIADGGLQISSVTQLPRPSILVGDPDAWQARWSLFGSLRRHCRIVFDGCELAQVRALLQTRVLPPLLGAADQVWVREPAGAITRARLNLQNEQ